MSPGAADHSRDDDGDDEIKTKSRAQKLKVEKLRMFIAERSWSCKLEFLKLALLTFTFCMILSLSLSPIMHRYQLSPFNPRSRIVDMTRIWQLGAAADDDARYTSNLEINWGQIPRALKGLIENGRDGDLRVGLLNFNASEHRLWQRALPHAELSSLRMEFAGASVGWGDLFLGWVDEEEETSAPMCPSLPLPRVSRGSEFDVVAVKLPCDRSGGWTRDVARLHLQLAAAKVAVDSAAGGDLLVLIVTDCLPLPNLFACKYLVNRDGDLWLYKIDPAALEEKIQAPVGACQLVVPFEAKRRMYTEVGRRREAYATVLHSSKHYVCGAIAAAQSIRASGTARDLVILVDEEAIGAADRRALANAGWQVRGIRRIRNPKAKRGAYNEYNYSKFRLWQLTDYDRVLFVDADLLLLRNVDFLFALPELSAAANSGGVFNSGLMVLEPSECTFRLLMDNVAAITSYNGGDQGFLNEVFTWWHRVPRNMNTLKYFRPGGDSGVAARREAQFRATPPALFVIHYLGMKPWNCYRDYDCNWNSESFWKFASDAAHETWWRAHDSLSAELQRRCLLPARAKAALERHRRGAELKRFPDGHWRRNVTDPRRHV